MDYVNRAPAISVHGRSLFSIKDGILGSCNGWAFDDLKKSTPEDVWIELIHMGTHHRYFWQAHRYNRPALAAALKLPTIERSGISCEIVSYALPPGTYSVKVYQIEGKTAIVSDFSTYTPPPIISVD